MNRLRTTVCAFLCLALPAGAGAQTEKEVQTNVVFGMVSGLALLMNVHVPATPNGHAIVYVPGSGFHTPMGYGAEPITRYTRPWVPALVGAGYTVFVINHRAAPRFRTTTHICS